MLLPEPGDSSPIGGAGKIFITQAFKTADGRTVMCFERATGQQLWKPGTPRPQPEKRPGKTSSCNASSITDGTRVFGSAGLKVSQWSHLLRTA